MPHAACIVCAHKLYTSVTCHIAQHCLSLRLAPNVPRHPFTLFAGPAATNDQPVAGDDASTWSAYANKRASQCVEFVRDASNDMTVVIAAIISEPVDWLSMRLQRTDETGFSLDECMLPTGAVRRSQQHLFGILYTDRASDAVVGRAAHGVPMLLKHFGFSHDMMDALFSTVLYVSSQARLFTVVVVLLLGALCVFGS